MSAEISYVWKCVVAIKHFFPTVAVVSEVIRIQTNGKKIVVVMVWVIMFFSIGWPFRYFNSSNRMKWNACIQQTLFHYNSNQTQAKPLDY